jgi:hypothetical protein
MPNDIVLIESKAARNDHLMQMKQDQAQGILDQVKGLIFALWKGEGIASTAQIAEFYQVSEDVVWQAAKRHRDEFDSDGLKVLRGKDLKDAPEMMSGGSTKTSQATAWSPRAALRLGMLLRDSVVAKQVRNTLLDLVQHGIPAQNNRIRELELEATVFQEKQKLLAQTQMLKAGGMSEDIIAGILSPTSTIIHVQGPEVTVSATVDNRGRVINKSKTVSAATIARQCGAKNGTELVKWLKDIGRDDVLDTSAKVVPYDAIKSDAAETVKRLWRSNGKIVQLKVGETR